MPFFKHDIEMDSSPLIVVPGYIYNQVLWFDQNLKLKIPAHTFIIVVQLKFNFKLGLSIEYIKACDA